MIRLLTADEAVKFYHAKLLSTMWLADDENGNAVVLDGGDVVRNAPTVGEYNILPVIEVSGPVQEGDVIILNDRECLVLGVSSNGHVLVATPVIEEVAYGDIEEVLYEVKNNIK